MYNIAVIGAGQLGSRHLQALLKSKFNLTIYIIDPSETSLMISRERASEVNYSNKELIYATDFSILPASLFLVVIATSAVHRLRALQDVTSISIIDNLILEKVLFQNIDEYENADTIIKRNKIKTFINCPRRMFDHYSDLKRVFASSEKIELIYNGGDWGLACNAVHILDLFSYISGHQIDEINCSHITKFKESKRKGFFEVYGQLIGKVGDDDVLVLKCDESARPNTLMINSDNSSVFIDETNKKGIIARKDRNWDYEELTLNIMYQSEMTNLVLGSLIEESSCNLTSFDESKNIHKPLILSLTEYFKMNGIDGCPIT